MMPGVLELQLGASALRPVEESAAQCGGVPKGGKAHAGVLTLEQLLAATATLKPTQRGGRGQGDAEPLTSPSHAARAEVANARGRLRKTSSDTVAAKAPVPAPKTDKENRSPRLAWAGTLRLSEVATLSAKPVTLMPSACNSMHRYASRLAVLGSSRRRSGSRRLSPRLGRSSPPAGGGRGSASTSQGVGEGGGEGAVSSSTGPRGTQPDQGGGDAHNGAADSAASCRPQLPSVACGAPRGAESCSQLKAPSWARHSSPPNLLRLVFRALGCARHSGRAVQPLRAEWGGCGVAVSPG